MSARERRKARLRRGWQDLRSFHAIYGEFTASIPLTGDGIDGYLPRRAMNMVLEWRGANVEALSANWQKAQKRSELSKIPPLP
ncbi:DUF4160 domain-containing protein [Nibricoccus sp. IMCC34717]|uniref:DUF4160 domain-containing protein n=1 Tax=Nibricoccus sp. IMCC34717 TaxID=3034021 RepID=UPI00384AD471